MSADLLLTYMSFRAFGRRDDLPKHLLNGRHPSHVLWEFAVLGHLEITANAAWQIVPPTLAGLGDETGATGEAILCGARTPALREKLLTACRAMDTVLEETPSALRPARIILKTKDVYHLAAVASFAGLALQQDAGFTLLASLPRIREWPRERILPIAGRTRLVQRFSRSGLCWRDTTLDHVTSASKGFFRVKRDYDTVTILKEGRDLQSAIETSAGRLSAARGSTRVRIDAAARTFSIPAALAPPIPIARALAINAGALPDFHRSTKEIVYAAVTARAARLTLEVLELKAQ